MYRGSKVVSHSLSAAPPLNKLRKIIIMRHLHGSNLQRLLLAAITTADLTVSSGYKGIAGNRNFRPQDHTEGLPKAGGTTHLNNKALQNIFVGLEVGSIFLGLRLFTLKHLNSSVCMSGGRG